MLFGMCLMFLLTTGGYGFLLWLACRRIMEHLKGDPQATEAFTRHVLVPLFGRRKEAAPDDGQATN